MSDHLDAPDLKSPNMASRMRRYHRYLRILEARRCQQIYPCVQRKSARVHREDT